ncbi:membrane protein insertase YidC [Candidatus Saccharibacteria bacterium TM7i]|nr:membrane protein insertase YidC [Candidatus Saccharibacteria bacterium TM7i]
MNIFELFIVQPIFNLLLAIYSVVPFADFGIAVILFTILVRFALWPLVVKQLHQVKAMRKLQPELARIKKASKGNRQLEGVQMLELYRKHGVKPFRSILILLIQLPIFIALFRVIQIFTTHRDQIQQFTYSFMQSLEPVRQLVAEPDSFNKLFLGVVDITSTAISSQGVNIFLILLAVAAAYTQYIISKQTSPQSSNKRLRDVLAEAGEGKQPDQAELNAVMASKMIKFLPFMMFFIMMSLPGAIGLYYVTSNLFAAIQQHFLLKRDVEEMEELADKQIKKEGKKATAKARAKQAREAAVVKSGKKSETKVTRITAKDTPRKSKEG